MSQDHDRDAIKKKYSGEVNPFKWAVTCAAKSRVFYCHLPTQEKRFEDFRRRFDPEEYSKRAT